MRTYRRAFCAASILLAALFVSSCDNAFGIFQGVQGEKAQVGTKVFQKTQVKTAFRLGSSYYAVTQSLNTKAVGTAGWTKVNIPAGNATYTLRSAVLAGSTIYALTETGDPAAPTLAVYGSTDGAVWTAVATLPAPTPVTGTTFKMDALFAANNELYAEVHASSASGSSYSLYHLSAGSLNNPVANFVPAADKTIRGVIYDSTKYWFASEDKLVSATNPDGTGSPTDESPAFTSLSTKSIWGLSLTGGSVYISTKDGVLYRSGTAAGASVTTVPLTQVVEVPAAAGTTLLAGTDALANTSAKGYYEGAFGAMELGSVNAVVALNSSIYSTTVSSFPVHDFYYDAAASTLFVCISPGTTSNKFYGLYSSVWDGTATTWSGWSAE